METASVPPTSMLEVMSHSEIGGKADTYLESHLSSRGQCQRPETVGTRSVVPPQLALDSLKHTHALPLVTLT